jgi:hypothetical protein
MKTKMLSRKKLNMIKMQEEMLTETLANNEKIEKQNHYDRIIYCIKNASEIRDWYNNMVKMKAHFEWCKSLITNVYDDIYLELIFRFHPVSIDDCICDCDYGSDDPMPDFKFIKKIDISSVITIPLPRAFNDYIDKNITDIDISHEYLGDLLSVNYSFFSMFKNKNLKYKIISAKIIRNIL